MVIDYTRARGKEFQWAVRGDIEQPIVVIQRQFRDNLNETTYEVTMDVSSIALEDVMKHLRGQYPQYTGLKNNVADNQHGNGIGGVLAQHCGTYDQGSFAQLASQLAAIFVGAEIWHAERATHSEKYRLALHDDSWKEALIDYYSLLLNEQVRENEPVVQANNQDEQPASERPRRQPMRNRRSATAPITSKTEFLQDEHVWGFIEYLKPVILGTIAFNHTYANRRARRGGPDRNSTRRVEFSSLQDALAEYWWDGSFQTNRAQLNRLQDAIRQARTGSEILTAGTNILAWGHVKPHNVSWLEQRVTHLTSIFEESKVALSGENIDFSPFENDIWRMNAGFTKIYALLCEEFIIYDSRVAAALGLLIRRYCDKDGLASLPPLLNFGWAPAKEALNTGNPKLRNPSTDRYRFCRLSGGKVHAWSNVRANWLLSATLRDIPEFGGYTSMADKLRALEAALFMIGYDLSEAED